MNTLGFIMKQLMRPRMAEYMAEAGDHGLAGAARLFGNEDLSDPSTVRVMRDWLEEQGSPLASSIDQYVLGRPQYVAYRQYIPPAADVSQPGYRWTNYSAQEPFTPRGVFPYYNSNMREVVRQGDETVGGIPWEHMEDYGAMDEGLPGPRPYVFGYELSGDRLSPVMSEPRRPEPPQPRLMSLPGNNMDISSIDPLFPDRPAVIVPTHYALPSKLS